MEVNADSSTPRSSPRSTPTSWRSYPHGRFLKIVEKAKAKQTTIPTCVDPDAPYTTNEQMVTRLFKIRYVDVEPLRGRAAAAGHPRTATPSRSSRTRSSSTTWARTCTAWSGSSSSWTARLRPTRCGSSRCSTRPRRTSRTTIQKLFESQGQRPGARPGDGRRPRPPGGVRREQPAGGPGAARPGGGAGGPATLTQLIPDERTNKLIVVASPAAFERIDAARPRRSTSRSPARGAINVYYLENANAEELASTLQSPGAGHGEPARRRAARAPRPPPAPPPRREAGAPPPSCSRGEVKISADKATNSLVMVAQPVRLPEPRPGHREARHPAPPGLRRGGDHGGEPRPQRRVRHQPPPAATRVKTDQGTLPGIVGTKYTSQRRCRRRSPSPTSLASAASSPACRARPSPAVRQLRHRHPRLRRGAARAAAELGRERALHAAPPHQRQRGGGDHRGPERALPGRLLARPAGRRPGAGTARRHRRRRPASGSRPGRPRLAVRADQPPERRAQAQHQAADQRERLHPHGHQRADRGDRLAAIRCSAPPPPSAPRRPRWSPRIRRRSSSAASCRSAPSSR